MPQTRTKRRKPPPRRRPGAKNRADREAEARLWRELDDAQRARYLQNPLAFTIHDEMLSPNNRAPMEPTTTPEEWSASERRVWEPKGAAHGSFSHTTRMMAHSPSVSSMALRVM